MPMRGLSGARSPRRYPPGPSSAAGCQLNAPSTILSLRSSLSRRETRDLVEAVNHHVNRSLTPMLDENHWGKIDQWDLPRDGYGDCEDYQLLKRKLLVEAGLPRRAMRMTVVIDDIGEGHAVLTILTDAGDFILDNKVDAVLPWHQVKYEFVKRESTRAAEWLFLEHEGRTDMIAMAR